MDRGRDAGIPIEAAISAANFSRDGRFRCARDPFWPRDGGGMVDSHAPGT